MNVACDDLIALHMEGCRDAFKEVRSILTKRNTEYNPSKFQFFFEKVTTNTSISLPIRGPL